MTTSACLPTSENLTDLQRGETVNHIRNAWPERGWPRRARMASYVLRSVTLTAVLATLVAAGADPASASARQVPHTHFGTVCKPGHSHEGRSATICIIRNGDDISGELNSQALVTFSTTSGTLSDVSEHHLWLLNTDTQTIVESNDWATKSASGRSAYISTGWYTNVLSDDLEAFVYDPCMSWTDGDYYCLSGWYHSCEIGACQSGHP